MSPAKGIEAVQFWVENLAMHHLHRVAPLSPITERLWDDFAARVECFARRRGLTLGEALAVFDHEAKAALRVEPVALPPLPRRPWWRFWQRSPYDRAALARSLHACPCCGRE